MSEVNAYIGLGSNLDAPETQLDRGVAALRGLPGTRVTQISGYYASAPMGPQDQPDYRNATARIMTTLAPLTLLDALQEIEDQTGRQRNGQRWGARTLDLDLLIYGFMELNLPRLRVPHPGIKERAFVLFPLAEIVPDGFCIPGLGSLDGLLEAYRGPPAIVLHK